MSNPFTDAFNARLGVGQNWSWDPANYQTALTPAMMQMMRDSGGQTVRAVDGSAQMSMDSAHNGGQYVGDQWVYNDAPLYNLSGGNQDGQRLNYYYNADGTFKSVESTAAQKVTDIMGILSVLTLGAAGVAGGLGAGAAEAGAGTAAGAGAAEAGAAGAAGSAGAGAAGAGVTGFGEAGLMYGGADAAAAASLGGGASVGGGSALGTIGAGVTGFGDAGAMYGGLDAASAGTLGGGASVNGGAALGSAAASPGWSDLLQKGMGNMTGQDWLGLATTALGAFGGAQGQDASQTSTRAMDPRMDSLFYGGLAPAAMGLLGGQMPSAINAGNQMMSVGSGLLGQTAPTTATNPYLKSIADDMQRRTSDMLGQNNLSIQGNSVSSGGLGGSRQGVAQGIAAGNAADSLQGNVANLYGTAYTGDQNRLLQQQTLGAGLMSQGLNTQFSPIQNTVQAFSPFTGFGSTTNTAETGGGWQGALGGALGAAQLSKNMGWW